MSLILLLLAAGSVSAAPIPPVSRSTEDPLTARRIVTTTVATCPGGDLRIEAVSDAEAPLTLSVSGPNVPEHAGRTISAGLTGLRLFGFADVRCGRDFYEVHITAFPRFEVPSGAANAARTVSAVIAPSGVRLR